MRGTNSSIEAENDAAGLVSRIRCSCRERPYASLLIVGSALVGGFIGALFPMGELSVLRRVAGAYFALFPLGHRLFK